MSQGDDTEVEGRMTDATVREGPGSARRKPERATPGGAAAQDNLGRGDAVGRYIILHTLGAGGMGVVYAAYDPELDRKVAVKLLQARPGHGTNGDQAWLLREAQAMARVSHPNVIAVHDVGTLPGDRVFIAMELVDGDTLRAWLRVPSRPWRDVVQRMLLAGAGLAAAHAQGLVHRDFKPDNVLVGKDGRVRVMDFGLARLRGDRELDAAERQSDSLIETKSPLSDSLTIAGTVVGTPAYMAPELYKGDGADARTDQFAFGVTLYEALFHARPFPKDATRSAQPNPPPAKTEVPTAVQRVVMRAVATKREERYPSMDALLAELTAAIAPPRRTWIAVGAAACASAAVLGVFGLSRGERVESAAAPVPCQGFERRLDGVWDEAQKRVVRTAFEATKKPFAARAYAGLERALDGYATEWTQAATDSCEATRLRGEQTEEVLTLRQACLDQRRDELKALVGLLATADGPLVEKGDRVAFGLEPVKRCTAIAVMRAPSRPPAEPAAVMAELHQQLASSKAEMITGRYFPAITAATRAAELAAQVKYEPFRAEALLVHGAALAGIGNLTDAQASFREAIWAALYAGRDDLVAGGSISAAAVASQGRHAEGPIWLGLARTAVRRMNLETYLEQRLRQVEGLVAAANGDGKAALEAQQQALAASERLYGPNSPMVWNDLEVMGVTHAKSGAYDKALPYFERSLKLREASVGADHPDVAVILTNLGACYSYVKDEAKARAAYERALAIRERVDGPNNPMLILTLNNMADGMSKAGDHARALEYVDRARSMAERLVGKGNPLYHAVTTTRAEALAASGKLAEARKTYDEALALEVELTSPYLGPTLTSRANLELGAKRWADAARFAQRAITAIEATGAKDAPELWQPLYALARARLGQGQRDGVRELLDRAIAIADQANIGPGELGPVRALRDGLGEK